MRSGKRRWACALVAVACAVLPGCSLFASSMQVVHVSTNEPDAEILIDGGFVGRGTASVNLERDRGHVVMARLGDRVSTFAIDKEISTTGILDLVGCFFFLFPIIGIVGDGFWDLDPQAVVLVLPPAPKTSP